MLSSKSVIMLVAGLLAGAAATAQEAPAGTGTAAATTTTDNGLQEVVVTAQFRKESVQDTPLAITAISGDALAERGQTSIAQVAADVPSLTLLPSATAFGPSMSAYIRGVGQYDQDPALEPGIGIYIDDVYFGTLTGSLMDLLDLDRVEVLRGPQGTLEGMNSEGGAVKLFSKQPDSTPATTFDALYGSRNHVELRASTNFVLIPDTLFIRIAGVGNHQDGYENVYDFGCANPSFTATATDGVTGTYSVAPGFLTNAGNCLTGQEGGTGYTAGRVAVRWVINDRLDATFTGDLTNENQELPAETLLYAGPGSTGASAGVENITIPTTSGAQLPYDSSKVPAMIPSNIYSTYTGLCMPAVNNPALGIDTPQYCIQNDEQLVSWGASAVVNWSINDELSLKNILADRGYHSHWGEDNDASPWPVGLGNEQINHHQFSEELRLNGGWSQIMDWTVGGFYFRELSVYATHQDLWYATDTTYETVPGAPPGFFNGFFDFTGNDPILAHDKAGYLHTVWHLTPKLNLTAALRYTNQDKTYTFSRLDPAGQPGGTAAIVAALNGVSSEYTGSRVDYRGVLDYRWTDQLMTYAQVSTGFKGGGVNPRPFFPDQAVPFKPETLTTYEAGIKTTWLDNRLRVNIDGYYSQYKDMQLALLDCAGIDGISAATGAPCALPYNAGNGDEKGVEFEAQARLGGLSIDANFSYLDFAYTSLNPVTGISNAMVTPFTPTWQGGGGMQYTQPMGSVGSLSARLDGSTRSDVYTNAVNAPSNRIGGYTTYNAHLTWEPPKADWSVTLQLLNLTDKRYFTNLFDLTSVGGGSIAADPAPPLELDVEVRHTL